MNQFLLHPTIRNNNTYLRKYSYVLVLGVVLALSLLSVSPASDLCSKELSDVTPSERSSSLLGLSESCCSSKGMSNESEEIRLTLLACSATSDCISLASRTLFNESELNEGKSSVVFISNESELRHN